MPRRLAIDVLRRVEEGDAFARDALDALAATRELAPRDRDLARELAQGVLRCRGAIDAVLAARTRKSLGKTDPTVLRVLRLGAYQLLFLDRVPARAAVHTSVELAKEVGRGGAGGFVNAVLRGVAALRVEVRAAEHAVAADPRRTLPRGDGTEVVLAEPVFPDPAGDLAGHLAARWSHPRWMVERFLGQHGRASTAQWLAAGIARPGLALRPAAGRSAELAAGLRARGLAVEEEGPCLLVHGAGPVAGLPGWDEGAFAVQDPTAAEVVPLLAPAPGAAVLELCAAPGGKTLQLAEAVGPEGAVLAVDLPGERTEKLRAELARRGISNVAVLEADATDADAIPSHVAGRRGAGFDAVLVDVPCSNTGVLARRVEARWRLAGPRHVEALATLQARLLRVAAARLRAGGRLAWSTCSLDAAENSEVVNALLREDSALRLERERLTLPAAGRRDGGYVAVVVRS